MTTRITIGRISGLLIALGYLVAMIVMEGFNLALAKSGLALLLPLALIWFPDELGSFTGYVGRGGNIQTETPPILVAAMGWFLLLGLPALIYFLR